MEAVSTWPAPSTPTPVHATVTVPGSKSQTNRALVLAALATAYGTSTISGALRSRDTDLMIGALQTLGVAVDGADSELTISGAIAPQPCARIECGLAGTVLRFVPPVAALSTETVAVRRRRAGPGPPDRATAGRASRPRGGYRRRRAAVLGPRRRVGGRRHGGDRRVGVVAVRLRVCCCPGRRSPTG